MTALVDTSVLIDYLRGQQSAGRLLEQERAKGILHASRWRGWRSWLARLLTLNVRHFPMFSGLSRPY